MTNHEAFNAAGAAPEVQPAAGEVLESAPPSDVSSKHAAKLHSRLQKTKKIMQVAVVTAEAAPLGQEALRYGVVFAGTLAATGSAELAGAALGGSTLLIEGVGALAAAELLNSGQSTRMLNWANRQARKIIPEGVKIPPYAEVPIAMTAGTPALMAAKNAADPTRTLEQNRRHGVFTATWMAALIGTGGGLLGESIEKYNDPRMWAASAIAIGGLGAVVKTFKKLAKKQVDEDVNRPPENPGEDSVAEESPVRYDLSPEELRELEEELVGRVRERFPQEGLCAAWIKPRSKYANIIRMYEAGYFPEAENVVSDEEENQTLFLALVDTRPTAGRVVHGAALSGVQYRENDKELVDKPLIGPEATGFITVDLLIEQGNFSVRDFYDYYSKEGLDLNSCLSVETNFRIGEKAEPFDGLTPAQLAYITIFRRLEKRRAGSAKISNQAVFSSVNRASVLSFKRMGIQCDPLMGRTDFKTPEAELGRESLPVAIMPNEHNIELFESLAERLPEITL